MVDHLMFPLEKEWLNAAEPMAGGIQSRVKNLRMKIFPEMSRDEIDQAEKDRRWQQLSQTYLAQQIDCYPENYIVDLPSIDRLIDTLEKFEEDLIGQCRIHGKTKVILDVGEAIEVPTLRHRSRQTQPRPGGLARRRAGVGLARRCHSSYLTYFQDQRFYCFFLAHGGALEGLACELG